MVFLARFDPPAAATLPLSFSAVIVATSQQRARKSPRPLRLVDASSYPPASNPPVIAHAFENLSLFSNTIVQVRDSCSSVPFAPGCSLPRTWPTLHHRLCGCHEAILRRMSGFSFNQHSYSHTFFPSDPPSAWHPPPEANAKTSAEVKKEMIRWYTKRTRPETDHAFSLLPEMVSTVCFDRPRLTSTADPASPLSNVSLDALTWVLQPPRRHYLVPGPCCPSKPKARLP